MVYHLNNHKVKLIWILGVIGGLIGEVMMRTKMTNFT
jgi:hypothetical protein